jgi:hypothetical protein
MLATRILLASAIFVATAHAGGPGSGRRCNPDAAVCTACRDCTRCAACAKGGMSCSVMRDQSGAQQRARDAKRAALSK